MAIDPGNETARRAFGYEPAPPPPTGAAPGRAVPSERQLADWWVRAGAFVLDQIVMVGIAVIIAVVVILIVGDQTTGTTEIVVYAVAIPASFLYAPLLMMRRGERNGQTLGKQALGIRVVRTTDQPVGFWNGFLRNGIAQQLLIAITFYVYALFDYLWPLRDAQNQALHDKIAKTWVVRTAPAAVETPAWEPPTSADERPVQGWLPPTSGG
jgi:uncharacterized RDD family membrane protein YckC